MIQFYECSVYEDSISSSTVHYPTSISKLTIGVRFSIAIVNFNCDDLIPACHYPRDPVINYQV